MALYVALIAALNAEVKPPTTSEPASLNVYSFSNSRPSASQSFAVIYSTSFKPIDNSITTGESS